MNKFQLFIHFKIYFHSGTVVIELSYFFWLFYILPAFYVESEINHFTRKIPSMDNSIPLNIEPIIYIKKNEEFSARATEVTN